MLTALRRAGSPKPAWLGPREHLERLGVPPAGAAAARAVVEAFYSERFGGLTLSEPELEAARAKAREFAAGMGNHRPSGKPSRIRGR